MQEVITRSPPSVILLELNPLQAAAVGSGDAPSLLQHLYDLGYTDISHSGSASCSLLSQSAAEAATHEY